MQEQEARRGAPSLFPFLPEKTERRRGGKEMWGNVKARARREGRRRVGGGRGRAPGKESAGRTLLMLQNKME